MSTSIDVRKFLLTLKSKEGKKRIDMFFIDCWWKWNCCLRNCKVVSKQIIKQWGEVFEKTCLDNNIAM